VHRPVVAWWVSLELHGHGIARPYHTRGGLLLLLVTPATIMAMGVPAPT